MNASHLELPLVALEEGFLDPGNRRDRRRRGHEDLAPAFEGLRPGDRQRHRIALAAAIGRIRIEFVEE